MNVARRGLTVLVGGTALALSVAVPAVAHPATAAPTPSTVTNACSQHVPAGHFTCFALRRTDVGYLSAATLAAHPNATPSGYGPSNLQSAYKLPSSSAGTGQRVYIVDANDDKNAESDLGVYRSQFGLPACTTASGCFQKLNQNGATSPLPSGDTGWAAEESLDLDMVSAICPNCGITLLEANSATDANLYTAVRTANSLGAKFVSMSWGGSEDGSEASNDANFSSTGVVYTASTGDSGYSAGVIYPSTSPRVVSVGGTSLTSSSNSRGWTESAWSGAGSGCSSDEAKPSWQSSISACTKRADADVSAVADPNTGVAVYLTYGGSGWTVYGGTSASAPIIASTYALAGTPAAGTSPASLPYGHTANLFDVTSGSNGSCSPSNLCHGTTGWDGPTGLGTPNGVTAFGGSGGGGGNTVTVNNPGNQTGKVGTAVSLQITGSDSGGAGLSYSATGLPSGLSISTSGLVTGTPTTASTYNVTVTATDSTGASGSAAFTWTISTSGSGCSGAGQKLGNPGFETGSAAPWSASSGVIDNSSAEPAHTGSWKAWLDGYGTTHTDTLSQSVTIPSGCSATLSFYLHIDTSETTTRTAYDKLTVKLGSTTLATYSNLNKNSGYLQRSFNVSSFAGKTVTLGFTGTEDSSLQTSFVLDDAALTAS